MSNINKYSQFISEQVRKERVLGIRPVNEATVSIDYDKAKGHADPEYGSGNRYSSKHKADHIAALKKAGASDEHAAAIHAHANASDHEDSNKSGYQVMSKHGKFTVHSKHVGDPNTMGGSGHVKYHVVAGLREESIQAITEDKTYSEAVITEAVNTDKYSKFIADQARGERVIGLRSQVNEAKDPHEDMENDGWHHFHTTPEGHHIYAHEETDRGESLHYAVKHPDGKVTHHSIEHAGEPVTSKQMNSKQEWHNVSKHDIPHDSVRKVIHKDIKDETSDY